MWSDKLGLNTTKANLSGYNGEIEPFHEAICAIWKFNNEKDEHNKALTKKKNDEKKFMIQFEEDLGYPTNNGSKHPKIDNDDQDNMNFICVDDPTSIYFLDSKNNNKSNSDIKPEQKKNGTSVNSYSSRKRKPKFIIASNNNNDSNNTTNSSFISDVLSTSSTIENTAEISEAIAQYNGIEQKKLEEQKVFNMAMLETLKSITQTNNEIIKMLKKN